MSAPAARALLAGSAPVCDPDFVRGAIARARGRWLVVAANGGRARLAELGIAPDVTIGDFDSHVAAAQEPSGREERHPRDKDETDLELAFAHAARQPGIRAVTVIGALAARLDHTLTNLDLGARWARAGLAVTLLDGSARVRFARAGAPVDLAREPRFDTVSLIPYTPAVRGIATRGLAFPLRGGTLLRERGRGVSNRLTGARGRVTVRSGLLLVIETRT